MKMRVLRCAPWGSKCASEAAAVNERQQHSKGAVAAELQQQELGFRRQLVGFAAPLWGHPPQLYPGTCQEPVLHNYSSQLLVLQVLEFAGVSCLSLQAVYTTMPRMVCMLDAYH